MVERSCIPNLFQDYLVDNAAVHAAEAIHDEISSICNTSGVNLRFLPAYSPELNSSIMKHHLRYWKASSLIEVQVCR